MRTIVLAVALLVLFGCSKNDLDKFSLGTETYPNIPDCKQVYFNGKPLSGIFLKRLIKADGTRLQGFACHDKNVVIDAQAGSWKEGTL